MGSLEKTMMHSRTQKHGPAYQEYYVGPRPDDKLPPLDYSQVGRFQSPYLCKANGVRMGAFILFLVNYTADGDTPSPEVYAPT